MSSRNPESRRIPINAPPSPMGNAFASLDAAGLPPGSEAVPTPSAIPAGGRLLLRRSTAHRAGRTVVVISGFSTETPAATIAQLAADLRRGCGTGGAVKNREIEIQGEMAEKIRELLGARGFRVAGP